MPNNSRALLLVVIASVALTSVPIESADKDHQLMMADLVILRQQNQRLEAQVSALTEALASISSRLEDQSGVSRRASADQKQLLENVYSDLRTVREQTSEVNVRLQSVSDAVAAVRDLRVRDSGQPGGVPAVDGAAQSPRVQQPTGVPGPGQSPQRMFDAALGDYFAGNYSLAVSGFESCIKSYPKSAVAADAQYYIGETRYLAGQFREAVAAYDALIAGYPASKLLADAYYKRGKAFASLGMDREARDSYEFVLKNYPDSDAGVRAGQAVSQMRTIRK